MARHHCKVVLERRLAFQAYGDASDVCDDEEEKAPSKAHGGQEKASADEAHDDQEKGPSNMTTAAATELAVLAEAENERTAEEERHAAVPAAQRLDIGNGKWIDAGVVGKPSEKRMDPLYCEWYTPGEHTDDHG